MPINKIARPKPISVTLITTKISPFTPANGSRGLAETSGLLTSALKKLGVDISVIAPYFLRTEAAVDVVEEGSLRVKMGGKEYRPRIKKIDAPFDPSYPVYFIEQREFYGREQMYYGYPEDYPRFAFLHKAALALHFKLGTWPDIFDVQEHQGSFMPLFLRRMRSGIRNEYGDFFAKARTTLGIHGFSFKGEVNGEEVDLSALYASELCPPNLIQVGLEEADMAYARSLTYLREIAEGEDGNISALVDRQIKAGKLVGLCANDEKWDPSREFSPELAEEAARHKLTVYLRLLNRPVEQGLIDSALPTFPPLVLPKEIWGARQKIQEINPDMTAFYDALSFEDRGIVCAEVYSGRGERLATITSKKELEILLDFLKMEPNCDFEDRLRREGFGEFVELFYPGELDRVFSLEVDLSASEENALRKMGNAPLFAALDKIGVIDHTIRLLKHLKLIGEVAGHSVGELEKMLSDHGYADSEKKGGSIRSEIAEYTMFSGIYARIKKNPQFFRAFIAATLLHDCGKCLKHDLHLQKGGMILRSLRPLSILFPAEQYSFLFNLVGHHSSIGDCAITREVHPRGMEKAFRVYEEDLEMKHLFLDALLIIGIADMDALGYKPGDNRGWLTPDKIKELVLAYKVAIIASDSEELRENLARAGFSPKFWGINLWQHWVVAGGGRITGENRLTRARQKSRNELIQYCRRKKLEVSQFKKELGAMEFATGVENLMHRINGAGLRARFIIRMVEIANHLNTTKLKIVIEDTNLSRLLWILKKHGNDPSDSKEEIEKMGFVYEFDKESGAYKISVRQIEGETK